MTQFMDDPADPGSGSNARVEVILHRLLPDSEEPNDIIGYYSQQLKDEIKRRGYYPMVRIMWAEDFELFAAASAARVASKIANQMISRDPLVTAIAAQTADKTAQVVEDKSVPARDWMTKEEYADHTRFSVRFVTDLLKAGLPHHGSGRTLRIPTIPADTWLCQFLDTPKPQKLDEVEAEAALAAATSKEVLS